ncbi:unnamed protein product [Protopolystoma xenopodis]|uniref:Uncharacterized protein n=1 Tax=Protopolystoma xenopodis TaxID=117903 RepID=A0A448WIC7_9PLAT|nr:unnamed protein product [Protopolystoma xenopodis]
MLQVQYANGYSEIGNIRWEIALSLMAIFAIVYFALWKGVKSSGKFGKVCSTRSDHLSTAKGDYHKNSDNTKSSECQVFNIKSTLSLLHVLRFEHRLNTPNLGGQWELVKTNRRELGLELKFVWNSVFAGADHLTGKLIKAIDQAVWITATLPYAILAILLVRGLLLEGASAGIKYYLTPQFDKLLDLKVGHMCVCLATTTQISSKSRRIINCCD